MRTGNGLTIDKPDVSRTFEGSTMVTPEMVEGFGRATGGHPLGHYWHEASWCRHHISVLGAKVQRIRIY